jgi:hypothetical protein
MSTKTLSKRARLILFAMSCLLVALLIILAVALINPAVSRDNFKDMIITPTATVFP